MLRHKKRQRCGTSRSSFGSDYLESGRCFPTWKTFAVSAEARSHDARSARWGPTAALLLSDISAVIISSVPFRNQPFIVKHSPRPSSAFLDVWSHLDGPTWDWDAQPDPPTSKQTDAGTGNSSSSSVGRVDRRPLTQRLLDIGRKVNKTTLGGRPARETSRAPGGRGHLNHALILFPVS